VPVVRNGNTRSKYIRFQWLAETIYSGPTAAPDLVQRKAHIKEWKFYTVGLRSGDRRVTRGAADTEEEWLPACCARKSLSSTVMTEWRGYRSLIRIRQRSARSGRSTASQVSRGSVTLRVPRHGAGRPDCPRRRKSPCLQSPSFPRVTLPRREIRRPAKGTDVPQKLLLASVGPGALQLLPDDSSHRHAGAARSLLKPLEKLRCKTNCECMTHLP
jgi:hypothetical protein